MADLTKAQAARLLRAAIAREAIGGLSDVAALRHVIDEVAPGARIRARRAHERKRVAAEEAARWHGDIPRWAKSLVLKYYPRIDEVVWRVGGPYRAHTSGHASSDGRITVTVGPDVVEQKVVLLHEIAHLLTPWHHHDDRFWDKMFELCRAEGVVEAAKSSESRSFKAAARRAHARTARPAAHRS